MLEAHNLRVEGSEDGVRVGEESVSDRSVPLGDLSEHRNH